MAANSFESMNMEFAQGTVDSTYIQLTPDRKNVENPPIERLAWPTYRNAEAHIDPPHLEAHPARSATGRAQGSWWVRRRHCCCLMPKGRNFTSFQEGAGTAPEATSYCCAECGFASSNRKHFKSGNEEGTKTCATGHYERDGELKRAKNMYARGR